MSDKRSKKLRMAELERKRKLSDAEAREFLALLDLDEQFSSDSENNLSGEEDENLEIGEYFSDEEILTELGPAFSQMDIPNYGGTCSASTSTVQIPLNQGAIEGSDFNWSHMPNPEEIEAYEFPQPNSHLNLPQISECIQGVLSSAFLYTKEYFITEKV